MDRHDYVRFAQAQGLRTLNMDGELWIMKRVFFGESAPPHRRVQLTAWQAAKLYLQGAVVIRYTCHDVKERTNSFEYICDDKNYDLGSLKDSKARLTRQGLKNCVVRQVDFGLLAEEGCAINQSVFLRQGRPGLPSLSRPDLWKKYMNLCSSFKDIEAWGAFFQDKLCAYMLLVTVDEYAYIFHPYSTTAFLQYRPMNALVFTVLKQFLKRPGVARVSYGLEPFTNKSTLDQFKVDMGFRRQPICRKILINPLARPVVSRAAQRIAERLLLRAPQSLFLHDLVVFSQAFQERRFA
ncbi:MAG: hypothetical protein JWN45_1893 [Acidobacteriaceae bacterium]|nr:hypothetical protein [Acidobacteriaceae bacterium]